MNHAYRLIWNDRLNAWSVAAEFVRSHGKRSGGLKSSLVAALLLAAAGVLPAHAGDPPPLDPNALPGGFTRISGQVADPVITGSHMEITQGSQRATINWLNFDIGSRASVNVKQLDSSSVLLSRVTGPTASRIEGQLSANGQVFLINPNGVLFGKGAQVNVGGLVASTLNIRDQDFLSGNYVFSGDGGAITNQGKINAAPGGYLAFIAPNITNSGTISAPQGTALVKTLPPRFNIPNTTTLPAAPRPRFPLRAPPK